MDKMIHANKDTTISKSVFGTLAFSLGALGVHDFVAKRYLYGCGHLALVIIAIAIFSVSQSNFLPPTLLIGSWGWAFWENAKYQKSPSNKATMMGRLKSAVAMAVVAEVFTVFTILLCILATVINMSGRNCYASGCSGAGWAIVIEFFIGLPVITITAVVIWQALKQGKAYLALDKDNKTVSHHMIAINILSIALIITIFFGIIITMNII